MPFNAPGSTLQQIITKVRRLTHKPSLSQITEQDIVDYVNTFLIYDFPEHLRTFNYRDNFSFECNAFQDKYPTNLTSTAYINNPLYNFCNLYITAHPPVYIAGFQQ